MLVYGGWDVEDGKCDRTGIHVFDMTKLMWEGVYDPNGGEYKVPKEIYEVIGGGPYGGATLLPENGMANSDMETKFGYTIKKPYSTEPATSKSGVPGGAIAGIVVGAFTGISVIFLGILWLRVRWRAGARSTTLPGSTEFPLTEIATKLAPGELPPHDSAPLAQELLAYIPNEMASRGNEERTGATYQQQDGRGTNITGAGAEKRGRVQPPH